MSKPRDIPPTKCQGTKHSVTMMRGLGGSLKRKAVKLDPTGNRERKGLMPAKTRKKIEIKAARGSLGIIANTLTTAALIAP